MRKHLLLSFIIISSGICLAQTSKPSEIDSKTVIGKLIGAKSIREFTNIKIKKSNQYKRCDFSFDGVEKLCFGSWEIVNDTLVLTEKFHKQKSHNPHHLYFYVFRKKIKTHSGQDNCQVTKLILYNGRWMQLGKSKFSPEQIYTQYVLKGLAWKPIQSTARL